MKKAIGLAAAITCLVLSPTPSKAIVIITLKEIGNDIVLRGRGSVDVTGLQTGSFGGSMFPYASFQPLLASFDVQTAGSGDYWEIPPEGLVNTFGSGWATETYQHHKVRGDFFAFDYRIPDPPFITSQLYLKSGYKSGDLFAFKAVFPGETLATAGVDEGTYEWSWNGGTQMRLCVGGNSRGCPSESFDVPGPIPLLGVGAAFGFCRKLRKRIKGAMPDRDRINGDLAAPSGRAAMLSERDSMSPLEHRPCATT